MAPCFSPAPAVLSFSTSPTTSSATLSYHSPPTRIVFLACFFNSPMFTSSPSFVPPKLLTSLCFSGASSCSFSPWLREIVLIRTEQFYLIFTVVLYHNCVFGVLLQCFPLILDAPLINPFRSRGLPAFPSLPGFHPILHLSFDLLPLLLSSFWICSPLYSPLPCASLYLSALLVFIKPSAFAHLSSPPLPCDVGAILLPPVPPITVPVLSFLT